MTTRGIDIVDLASSTAAAIPGGAIGQELGRRVRAARAKIGLTRRQLAQISGTSERYLANIETGLGNPSIGVLVDLARALGIAPVELLPNGGEGDPLRESAAALVRRLPDARLPALVEWMRNAPATRSARGRRIALIGLRGAGKSSLGSALAGRLGCPFLEMSREVERAYGGEMRLLIELGGQAAVRRYEHEALEAIVRAGETAVIATPGGIVADAALYQMLLDSAHCIWLTATPDDHMARVVAQGDFRPMAGGRSAMDDLKAILDARTPDYARAETRIDTSAADFEATLDALERASRALQST